MDIANILLDLEIIKQIKKMIIRNNYSTWIKKHMLIHIQKYHL